MLIQSACLICKEWTRCVNQVCSRCSCCVGLMCIFWGRSLTNLHRFPVWGAWREPSGCWLLRVGGFKQLLLVSITPAAVFVWSEVIRQMKGMWGVSWASVMLQVFMKQISRCWDRWWGKPVGVWWTTFQRIWWISRWKSPIKAFFICKKIWLFGPLD